MSESSRRQFLAATGAGAVGVGAAAMLPATMARAEAPASLDTDLFEGIEGAVPVIVSVEDAAAGLLSVMHGESEFTVTDPELASRITRLAAKRA